MKHLVYDKEFVNVYIDDEVPMIYEEWTGQTTPDEFKETLNQKLQAFTSHLEKYPALKWMTDIRGLRGIDDVVQTWATQEFHPKLFPLGVRKIAFIVAESIYYQLSTEQTTGIMDTRNEVKLCYFDNHEQAISWLNS